MTVFFFVSHKSAIIRTTVVVPANNMPPSSGGGDRTHLTRSPLKETHHAINSEMHSTFPKFEKFPNDFKSSVQ